MKKKKNLSVILAAALALTAVAAVVILVGLLLPERAEYLQGQAELTDYRLSSKVAARVLEIRVREGDLVRRGDTLCLLEAPDIRAKLSQAEAAYAAALAEEDKAHSGTRREQVRAAYEAWRQALAVTEVAEKTFGRIDRLAEEGVVAEQQRDEARARRDAAAATERAARAQYDMAVNGARREDRAAAEAGARRAREAVSEASSYVDETVLLAAADGVVTEVFPEPGELLGAGAPVMTVARPDDAWFTFNVREDLLPGLSAGTETEVYLPAFDRRVRVRVTKVKDVGSYAAWKATKALDEFDLRTFEVEMRPVEPVEGVREGMTAVMRR